MDAHFPQVTTVTDYSLRMERTGRVYDVDDSVSMPARAAQAITAVTDGADREYFVAVALNARNFLIGVHTVSIGSLTMGVVHPRELFKFAILANASALIVGHNHPSGDTTPSRQDLELTTRLVEAGRIMGIDILDHIIIGEIDYLSLKEHGYM